ncbi:hypothetical protein ASG52_22840 [Methylobacterium sp. Leaf456]|uniref:relaxase/mobilization nuclease domain-containing protein n=1 Tax=Methylobacterium sp. Leaf456 TaxID=1736382 RepID=UPI00070051F6|nr:hypothetical protein [Methylobacterium sp. Leaf456]KQT58053.1 hypothetical protein ASG52_22840 [Methylobacterium sp. Leaf456]
MILKGSQRAGARQLGLHLLETEDNEHVEVHEIRGFVSDNVVDALKEAYAVSRGTRCKQYLFSLSLSPPEKERVTVPVFEKAIAAIAAKLGLSGQPRVIDFHEKEGRRNAHCVWSRIDTDRMRAINLPHFKVKLNDLARKLYIEHGWDMPRGFVNREERDPLNFSRQQWQQARRAKRDPRALKALFQQCWAGSDSASAFGQALRTRGLFLARGDRRGIVAVDMQGEVYAVARWTGIPTKVIRTRLGDGENLKSVAEMRAHVAAHIGERLTGFVAEATRAFKQAADGIEAKRRAMVALHRAQRRALAGMQAFRAAEEARERNIRLRKGLLGIWDRVTGRHARLRRQNETEAVLAERRDAEARQALIDQQLATRRQLQGKVRQTRGAHQREVVSQGVV